MKQLVVLSLLIIISTLLLSACLAPNTPADNNLPPTTSEQTEKTGYTELTGQLQQQGKLFLLQTANETVGVESYSVDLSLYTGQTITVKGKYSGDTLYAEEILP